MYKDTITLFNRFGSKWYATIIDSVDLNVDRASIIDKYGENSKDNAKLHIKYLFNNGVIVGTKRYVEPKEYINQTEEQASNSLTFRSGDGFDFFMEGIWNENAIISDDDYEDGFYNYLNKMYDNVYVISSVGRYSIIPHFEILAK